MPELILALDVGTTRAKAAVIAPDGGILALAAAGLTTTSPAPGLAEQSLDAVWRAVRRVARQALQASGRAAGDLAAVGLAAQRASVAVWDRRTGAPAGPLVLWSDLRGAAEAARLRAAGVLAAPQQPVCKLEAVIAASGRAAGELAFGGVDSWLLWKLTGGVLHACDLGQAWPTGYLDLGAMGWNAGLIGRQGLGDLAFPRLVDSWGALGVTAPEALGGAVPITASLADQQAALLAHGEAPGTAKITWGTSGTFDVATPGLELAGLPALPPLVIAAAQGRPTFCVEGMILSAGAALDWLRERLGLGAPERLDALAAQAADAAGAAFLPALQGLGAPHGDPARLGRLVGLSAAVERRHLARAAYEGLAFRAEEILERAQGAGLIAAGAGLGVDGGLLRSRRFLQVLADLVQRPVTPLATPEATLMGAALLAARGAGLGSEPGLRASLAGAETVRPAMSADEAGSRRNAWRAAVHAGA